jgi:hypothetical protein
MDPEFPKKWRRVERIMAILFVTSLVGLPGVWADETYSLRLVLIGSLAALALSELFLIVFIRRAILKQGFQYPPNR